MAGVSGGGRGPIGSVLKGEDILHSAPKDMGDVHGQLQGGVVVSIFQVADGLPPHAHPLGQLLLAEPVPEAELPDLGAQAHAQSLLSFHSSQVWNRQKKIRERAKLRPRAWGMGLEPGSRR